MRVVTNGNHEEYSHLAPIVEPSQGIRPGKARCGFWTRGYTHHPLALERSSQNCTPYPNMGRKAKKKKAEKSRTLNIGTSQNKRSKSLVRPRSSSPASTSFFTHTPGITTNLFRGTQKYIFAQRVRSYASFLLFSQLTLQHSTPTELSQPQVHSVHSVQSPPK
jgi:hypothetical protein